MASERRLVIVESPYAADSFLATYLNMEYAVKACKHCLKAGHYPFASHLLYAQNSMLDDSNPDERALGITAGLAWAKRADFTIFFLDHGFSNGMREALRDCIIKERSYTYRYLDAVDNTILADFEQFAEDIYQQLRVANEPDHRNDEAYLDSFTN